MFEVYAVRSETGLSCCKPLMLSAACYWVCVAALWLLIEVLVCMSVMSCSLPSSRDDAAVVLTAIGRAIRSHIGGVITLSKEDSRHGYAKSRGDPNTSTGSCAGVG